MKRTLKFFGAFPYPLPADKDECTSLEHFPYPSSLKIEIEGDTLKLLREKANQRGCSLNDLLLRDLFLAIDENNRVREGCGKEIRISMPIDMRESQTRSAYNCVSMCFIDRKPGELLDRDKLLDSIRKETQHIKQDRMGLTLLRATENIAMFPGGLRLMMTPKGPYKCYATTVLSNLGRVFEGSDVFCSESETQVKLNSVELLPPFRPFTHAAFGVATFNSRLTITMNFDPRKLSVNAAQVLLKRFEQRLCRTNQ